MPSISACNLFDVILLFLVVNDDTKNRKNKECKCHYCRNKPDNREMTAELEKYRLNLKVDLHKEEKD